MNVDEALAVVETPYRSEAEVVLAAEVRRLRAVEQRVQRLLDECDRNEQHVRKNVPHLSPESGSFSVYVIRRFLGGTEVGS